MDAERKSLGKETCDSWLDAALRARVDAEPRMGLEDRVLANLAAEHPRETFSWMPLLAAAAAVVVISAVLMVTYSSRHTSQTAVLAPPRIQTAHSETQPTQGSSTVPHAPHRITAHRIARATASEVQYVAEHEQALPRLATFPAPSPETAQEHLLARLAARRDSYDVAVASDDIVPLKDLSIPKLNIEPVEGTPADEVPQH